MNYTRVRHNRPFSDSFIKNDVYHYGRHDGTQLVYEKMTGNYINKVLGTNPLGFQRGHCNVLPGDRSNVSIPTLHAHFFNL